MVGHLLNVKRSTVDFILGLIYSNTDCSDWISQHKLCRTVPTWVIASVQRSSSCISTETMLDILVCTWLGTCICPRCCYYYVMYRYNSFTCFYMYVYFYNAIMICSLYMYCTCTIEMDNLVEILLCVIFGILIYMECTRYQLAKPSQI